MECRRIHLKTPRVAPEIVILVAQRKNLNGSTLLNPVVNDTYVVTKPRAQRLNRGYWSIQES